MLADLKTNITQLCDSLLEAYRGKGLDVAASLQPPLSSSDIEGIATSSGLKLAPEMVALYQWRNGSVSPSGEAFLLAGKPFLSLESALSQREAVLAALHPKDRADVDLDGLLPFAGSANDWYAMAGPAVEGERPVFLVVEDAQPDFESLIALLKTSIDWVREPDWTPTSPPARARDIWYRHNPTMDA